MDNKDNFIYEEPLTIIMNKIMAKFNKENKSFVFLWGVSGSGKTTILKKMQEKSTLRRPIVDASISLGEYIIINDYEVFKVYHTCLVIRKILNYIENNYSDLLNKRLVLFKTYLNHIIDIIKLMTTLNERRVIKKECFKKPRRIIS